MNDNSTEVLRAKINLETAQIAWRELQRFFAGGMAIAVAAELDLVDVAVQIAEDNKVQVEGWLHAGKIGQVSDAQAKAWFDNDATLWALVVKPWVLVQPD